MENGSLGFVLWGMKKIARAVTKIGGLSGDAGRFGLGDWNEVVTRETQVASRMLRRV